MALALRLIGACDLNSRQVAEQEGVACLFIMITQNQSWPGFSGLASGWAGTAASAV